MNRLDAVASESYQLQSVIKEPEATETKDANQTPVEATFPEIEIPRGPISDTQQPEITPPSDISPTAQSLNELHSEEEDKFSDFDPTALPEEEPASSPKYVEPVSIVNCGEDQREIHPEKESEQKPTDDYMSDVSSGEEFLSATHDHSGPEDGEYSEGDESSASNQRENKIAGATLDATPNTKAHQVEQTFGSSSHQSDTQPEHKGSDPIEDLTLRLGKEESSQAQSSISSVLVDNASPINDEDLDSLDEYEHGNTVISGNETQTKDSESAAEKTDKNCSDLSKEERLKEYEGDICKEKVNECEISNSFDSHLNPEPIDSSPDLLLTSCGGDNDEDLPHDSDKQLTSAEYKNNPNFEGKPGLNYGHYGLDLGMEILEWFSLCYCIVPVAAKKYLFER